MIPPLDSLGGFAQALGWLAGKTGLSGSDLAMAPINALAGGIADGVGQLLATLGTLWIRLDVPNVWDGQTVGPTVAFLHSEVAPLVGLLAVLGIIVGACRLAWQQTAQPGVDLLEGLLVLVVVTGCGVPMIGLLASGADAWAQSIVRDALQDGDFAHNIGAMLRSQQSNVAPVLAIFFGIIALLVSAAMICLLAFRAAMLVLLAGLLPVAASMTTTQAGREYMRHYVAWVVAFIAWKPVAALIYAAAFRLIGTHGVGLGAGVGSVLIGLTLMTAAVLALPALLRFLVPATRALHAGSPAAATRHAAMRMPSGARRAVAFTHPATMAVSAGQAAATGVRHATGARQQSASVPPPEVSPPKPAPKPARRS